MTAQSQPVTFITPSFENWIIEHGSVESQTGQAESGAVLELAAVPLSGEEWNGVSHIDFDAVTGKQGVDMVLPQFGGGPGQVPYTPQDLEAMAHLAIAVSTNDIRLGSTEAQKAVALAPASEVTDYYLGKSLYTLSNNAGAKPELQQAVQRGDDRTNVKGRDLLGHAPFHVTASRGTRFRFGPKRVNSHMTSLASLAAFLNEFFRIDRFPQETNGILQPTERPVRRLGLALEPGAEMAAWMERERLDALLLHRAAKLDKGTLPEGLSVLGYHLPFDEILTLGWNLRLADVLGLTGPEVMGWKQGRPLGMIGAVASRSVSDYYRLVFDAFGGREESRTCERNEIGRVAVVGAMTEALVHEASERGADLYITGQLRAPGRVAMLETGIGVIAVGQKRGEMWGLRALAHLLQERFAEIEVVLPT